MTVLHMRYAWEGTLVAIIAGAVAILSVVSHLTARPYALASDRSDSDHVVATAPVKPSGAAFHKPTVSKPSNPLTVALGPDSIGGQFTLVAANRMKATPTSDKLTLHLRVASHAVADLVTPFQSVMLEVRSQDLEPISPEHPFSRPIPAGTTREESIAFIVPADLSLDRAVLRIHFYNEQGDIPLNLLPKG